MHVQLIPIDKKGRPANVEGRLDVAVKQVCAATAALYRTDGFTLPWIGYLAVHDQKLVGACAFKSVPVKNGARLEVEIGYLTFPKFEGRGIATEMVRELLWIAQDARTESPLVIVAQTGNEENASNAILRKFGFQFVDERPDSDGEMLWRWELEMPR